MTIERCATDPRHRAAARAVLHRRFSGGGITAFEIAHQLRAQGEEVALLAMLDSALPMEKPITAPARARIQSQRFQRQGPSHVGTWRPTA